MDERMMNDAVGQAYHQGEINCQSRYDLTEVYNRSKARNDLDKYVFLDKNIKNREPNIEKDVMQIYKGDLVFRSRNKGKNKTGAGGNIPVLAHINGHYALIPRGYSIADKDDDKRLLNDDGTNTSLANKFLMESLCFEGIARTKANASTTNKNRVVDGATIQKRGKNTITNTGPQEIKAGQRVMWTLPRGDDIFSRMKSDDRPKARLVPRVIPYDYLRDMVISFFDNNTQNPDDLKSAEYQYKVEFMESIKEFTALVVFVMSGSYGSYTFEEFENKFTENAFKELNTRILSGNVQLNGNMVDIEKMFLAKMLKAFFKLQDSLDSRFVGTATSSARPGMKFDILM